MSRWGLCLAAASALVFVALSIALRVRVGGEEAGGPARMAGPPLRLGAAADRRPPARPRGAWGRAAGATGSGREGLVTGRSLGAALEAVAGRPAVVNVWASWCPPCREELPFFVAAERRFGARLAFLGADLEDDDGSARALLREVGADYPSYPADAAAVASSLGPVGGAPVTFFLDRSGAVVDEHIGAYRSPAELDADLARHARPG